MTRAIFVALVATLALTSSGAAQTGADTAVERAAALAAAPASEPFVAGTVVPAATARVIADDVARGVPLPAGGTFSGIRWEEAGGAFSQAEIAAVLEYNAACQWIRAWRDGRQADVAGRVLADIPAWPAWRFGETAGVLGHVAADVRAGGGVAASGFLAECDAAHEREVAYAASRGLPVSR